MDRTLWKKAPLIAAALLATVCDAPAIFWSGPGAGVVAAHAAAQKEKAADRPAQKSQASLAAKTAFVTLAPTDPALAKATAANHLEAVRKLSGKESTLEGTVAKVYVADGNGIVILNFSKNFREAATAVVKPSNYAKFPDLLTLNGKKVSVTGRVREFRGRPEIELTDAAQVKIVK